MKIESSWLFVNYGDCGMSAMKMSAGDGSNRA
jgi:hypothetical protein